MRDDVVTATTAKGLEIVLRPGRPDDRDLLLQGFRRLSMESRYRRFFTSMADMSSNMADRLTDVDRWGHIALVAFDPSTPDPATDHGLPIGVARTIRSRTDPDRAELAITVVDDYQRRGVGRFLTTAIAGVAAGVGIDELDADVLAENRGMLSLLRSLGGHGARQSDDPTIVEFVLDCHEVAAHLPPEIRQGLDELYTSPQGSSGDAGA